MESMQLGSEASSNEEDDTPRMPSKTSKLRRSCELCRTHKARCNPSEGNPDRCHRCTRDGKPCVFLAAKARPKRAKNSKARVAEMEQKLDGLMALLHSQGKATQQNIVTPDMTPPPIQTLEDGPSSYGVHLNMTSQRQDILNNPHQFSLFSLPKPVVDLHGDVISKDVITYDLANECLVYYRSQSKYYPFVLISPHESLDTLRRERPFLLLSVLAMSAIRSSTKLQKSLELELRESLSRKTIVNGEKSMDILQGILVYIVWYHFFFEPQRQQIYLLTQMAITMATDLGINKPATTPTIPNMNPLDVICPIRDTVAPETPEAKRTLIACYILTSSVCQSFRKPNNMRYNDYLGECCSSFAQNPIADTDHLLQYFVRLQHFQDDVNAAFDYDSINNLQPLDSPRIEILLNTFNRQLLQFKESFPPDVWENPQITATFYSLRVYLHEIGFHAKPPSSPENIMLNTNSNSRDWYQSNARTESLFTCLQASKDYLDRILLLDGDLFISLTLPDFIRMIYVLLILGSFACLIDYPQIQALANLQYYLSALHQKTSLIITTSKVPIAGCFIHLNMLFEKTSAWHSQSMADPTPLGRCLMWHPQFNVPEMLPQALDRVMNFQPLFVEDEMSGQMLLWGGMQMDIGSVNLDWAEEVDLGEQGDLMGDLGG